MAYVATNSKNWEAGQVRQGTSPRMQEHIGESCDGHITKVVFGGPSSVGRRDARRGLPAAQAREVVAAGSTSDAPGTPVGTRRRAPFGSGPRTPVGRQRRTLVRRRQAARSVNLPDHNKCHTARPPSMGRLGTNQDNRSSGTVLPLFRRTYTHSSDDGPATPVSRHHVPSPGCQTGHSIRAAGLRN